STSRTSRLSSAHLARSSSLPSSSGQRSLPAMTIRSSGTPSPRHGIRWSEQSCGRLTRMPATSASGPKSTDVCSHVLAGENLLHESRPFRLSLLLLLRRRDHECGPHVPAVGPVCRVEFPVALEVHVALIVIAELEDVTDLRSDAADP